MDRSTYSSRARRQAALLGSCALGLVMAATPQAAHGQDSGRGFQGNVGPGGVGSVTVTTGSQSTTIDVNSAQAVVNWAPTDTSTSGTIDFLPEGYGAAFTSSTLSDYTVLNRILPGGTAKIGLNGNITSSASNGDGGQNVGGNVWFYTPNGFVVGPRATIQVGGLVMTTNDVVFGSANTGGDDLTDANGNVLFRGTTPGSSIVIDPGAQITGTHSNSYIALVAPRIEQGGYVSADRSIAYVAANKVDLKINAGNFDIVVGEGTEDANGIVHTGTTTGAGSFDYTDVKTMHFVAVPKNTALTMLLSGSIGYTPATSSYYDGGSIVLTAGDDTSPVGNIDIGAARFRSNLDAHATGDITVAPPSSESVEGINEASFESYATLSGDQSVHLNAVGGSAINAYRGLTLYSQNDASGGKIDITAGPASLIPPDPEFPGAPDQFTGTGSIFVYGGLSANASHSGGTSADGTTGLDAHGGTVNLFADGGSISSDYTYLYASAQGGFGTKTGGDGYGGTVNVRAGRGGSLSTSYLSADVRGDGGGSYEYTETGSTGGFGGVGHGGAITIADSSGPIGDDPAGGMLGVNEFSLDASSVGGNSLQPASGMGGDAFGGTIDITIDRQNQDLGYIYGYATAVDGDGGSLDPIGGDITMTVGGGVNVSLNQLYLNASAQASVNSPVGAFGRGGTIDLTVNDGATLDISGNTTLDATADVAYYYYDTIAQSSPDLTGGTVKLTADNGGFSTNNLNIDVSANNTGATTSAGYAHGGTAAVTATNGGSIATFISGGGECSECFFGGYFTVDAEGYGTSGLSANAVTGGDITLSSQSGGSIYAAAGQIGLYAGTSFGSAPTSEGVGVTGHGGTIAIDAIGGAIQTGIYADVSGQGGDADNGGGSGTGGTIAVRVLESGELQNPLNASAGGSGGFAYLAGRGGDGTGGRLTLQSDATAKFTNFGLQFYGDGQGGSTNDGVGGDGYGGSAQIDVIGGTLDWSSAYLSATGSGAAGYGGPSLAGSGYGSVDGLNFHLGGGADLTTGYIALDARGTAGSGGDGNEAIGGSASLFVDGSAILTADGIGVNATGSLAYEERSPDSFDTTPNAAGGTASAIADTGGVITTTFLEVVANGMTGAALTAAGSATGGTAIVGASAGGLIDLIQPPFQEGPVFGGLTLEAQGLGAEGPSAANATGGTATLYTAGGTINSVSGITVTADAAQGDFANTFVYDGPSNGFDATGGTASVEMRSGGTGGAITAPSLTVNARGLPNGSSEFTPVQGTGGIGQGGSATLSVAQGTLLTGPILIDASGRGGGASENPDGGAAFASGNGTGGSATFILKGGSVGSDYLNVNSNGTGGSGTGGASGSTGSLAGTGRGGSAVFEASGGSLETSYVLVDAQGTGGYGAYNPDPGAGGRGGDAFGGNAEFNASGTTALTIGSSISVEANAFAGGAGSSFDGNYGAGGNATGGTAAMRLADIPFSFAYVTVDAVGGGGYGTTLGTGTGGQATFDLTDTGSAAVAPRTIDTLLVNASGYLASEEASVAGTATFGAHAGSPDAGLTITDDLQLIADGTSGPAGYGIVGSISGAKVTVGGSVSMSSPRDGIFTINDDGALDVAGNLSVLMGGSFTSSGLISAGGNAEVNAAAGINMTDLSVGGTTLLTSLGPVTVSRNLGSAGPVTVSGSSVLLRSFGGLTFADADATDGNLEIETAGDLLVATVDATGTVTLTSTGGSVHNTGTVNGVGITYNAAGNVVSDTTVASGGFLTVDAGGTFSAPGTVSALGNVNLSADLGLNLAAVVSGGTTALAASDGALVIGSLSSPGAVTALGRSVAIASPGALSFANAQATAGDLTLSTTGSLTLAQGGASGAVQLGSKNGSVTGSGPVIAGGDLAIGASTGIQFGTLGSGGTTSLVTQTGPVTVASLSSAGDVTARGETVSIASPGALTFADIDAVNGDVVVQTVGTLTLGTIDATGQATLTSTGGAIAANGAITANGIVMSSLANLALNGLSTPGLISLTSTSGTVSSTGPIAAGGNLSVAGNAGITLGTATSGGTTALTAANGAVNVATLLSSGPVTASGRSLTIGSSGALQFANAVATAGDIGINTAGNLVVSQASASGALGLTSSGGSVASTGTLTSGGNAAVSGQTGVALAALTSGGTTSLTSANGNVVATALTSAGSVTAVGRSVGIVSPGALSFTNAQATTGNLNLTTAGNLAVAQASAANTLRLTSTGGTVTGTGAVGAGGNVSVSGDSGIAMAVLTSGGTTALASASGAVGVTDLNSTGAVTASGRSVTIGSSGALTFADLDATAGNVAVTTAGNLAVNTVDATGSVTLTSTGGSFSASGAINGNGIALSSLADLALNGLGTAGAISLTSTGGSVSSTGPLTAGGNLAVSGNSGINLGTASSGGTTSLVSANGAVVVSNLASAGAVTAAGRAVTIGSTGALSFADLDATAGNVAVQTAGNLVLNTVDATGNVTLASTGGSVSAAAPVSAGGSVAASGQTGATFGALNSGGPTTLTAANGAVGVSALTSAGAVTASGRSVDLRGPGSLDVASAQASAGNLALQAVQNLTVGNASASGTVALTAGGDLRANGLVTGAGIGLSGTNVTIGGQVRSTASLDILARQLLTVSGLAAGQNVVATAADIAIGQTGRIGSRGLTKSITLRNRTVTSPMNIGGTGTQGQFSLDKSEAARLFADEQITFVSSGGEGGGGDVRIGDLALAFGDQANIGTGGLLKVDAGGVVEVNGAVALTTVSNDDGFSIDPQRIDVIAGSGSIVMKNASGALQGVLELQADDILVADRTTLDAIAGMTAFDDISSLLDKPGPVGPDGGYLQAGTINLLAGDSIYIQNGGTTTEYEDRRGFRANALNIETDSSSPRIAINGVIVTPTGDLVGLDTQQAVSINGVYALDLPKGATVTINGCPSGVNCGIPDYSFGGLSSDELERLLTTADEPKNGPSGQAIQVEETQPLITPPLVDEPITGVGNDDLWQVKCTPEGDKSCPAEEGS